MWTTIYCGPAPVPTGFWSQWNLDPWLIAGAGMVLATHALSLRHERTGLQVFSLVSAWLLAAALLISPLCALTAALFSARVGHHVILIAVIAPLLVLALPRRLRTIPVWSGTGIAGAAIVHALLVWVWHAPQAYAAALSSHAVYWLMELSLLGSALLLWHAVLSPSSGTIAVMSTLVTTVAQMGLLGALITFAPSPLYEPHLLVTAPWGLTAHEDQQLAGLIMWVLSAIPYAAAGLALVARRLGDGRLSTALASRP